ncbi:MAG TPA: hypothetical protein PKM27_09725 [Saprospiraceae bacterium]|nr:hypothetical protein [Saprospiraceae bacterium]HNT21467.1 hypothetical protein [Saprospiraceae bacterium]
MNKFIISVFFFSLLTCKLDKKEKINNDPIKKYEVSFDTLKFLSPAIHYSSASLFKVVNNSILNDIEVMSISNFINNTIQIYDFKKRKIYKTIQLHKDGPDRTLTGQFGFTHQIIPGNKILVLDPLSYTFSVIDLNGHKITSQRIPPDPNFEYAAAMEYSIQGVLHGDDFYYPAIPAHYAPLSNKDKLYDKLKHLIHYNTNTGFQLPKINRNNYYTLDLIYNTAQCCYANFVTSVNNKIFVSDCYQPDIKCYDARSYKYLYSIPAHSGYFYSAPSYDEHLSEQEYLFPPAETYRSMERWGFVHPSYYQMYIDTINHSIIRQAKLGMSDEPYYRDRTQYTSSFIFIDYDTNKIKGEALVKGGMIEKVAFFNGFITSEGLCFPFIDIQQNEDDHIYLVKAVFH